MIHGQVSVFILPDTTVTASSPSVSDYLDSSGMCMYYILYNNVSPLQTDYLYLTTFCFSYLPIYRADMFVTGHKLPKNDQKEIFSHFRNNTY